MAKTFFLFGTGPLIAALCLPVAAQTRTPAPNRGDHPAVVAQRLQARAGYDYASKFYPHPAWLYLRPAAPDAELSAAARARPEAATPKVSADLALARTDVE